MTENEHPRDDLFSLYAGGVREENGRGRWFSLSLGLHSVMILLVVLSPLFLPEESLTELQKTLKEYRPFIESFSRATNLNSLFRLVNQQFRTAKREENAENDSLVKAIPAKLPGLPCGTGKKSDFHVRPPSVVCRNKPLSPATNAMFWLTIRTVLRLPPTPLFNGLHAFPLYLQRIPPAPTASP